MGRDYRGIHVEGGKNHFGDTYYVGGCTIKQDHALDSLPYAEDAPFNAYHRQHDRLCLEGTRKDVLDSIYKWADEQDERCLFWLNGLAGTGKSTIARTVAHRYHTRKNLGASFFFQKGGGDVGTAKKFVTTISRQLASWSPSLKQAICASIQQQREIATKTLGDQWDELVFRPLSKVGSQSPQPSCIIVVDALDECGGDERDIKIILRLLAGARLTKSARLRILVTSRPEVPVQQVFGSMAMDERGNYVLHHISPPTLDRDVYLLLKNDLSDIARTRGHKSGWPGEEKIQRLVQNASGLIIWADTACRFIRDGKRLGERRLSIMLQTDRSGSAPEKRLDEIYLAVLRQTVSPSYTDEEKEDLCSLLRRILGSLAILFSSLSAESLSRLLDVPRQDVDETLQDLGAVVDIPDNRRDPLRLHHPSFRDFVLHKERCDDSNFWVDETQMHREMTMRCLNVMSTVLKQDICCVSSPDTLAEDVRRVGKHLPPEVQYACSYWMTHLQKSGDQVYDEGEVHKFLQTHLLHWLEALSWMRKVSEGILALNDLKSIAFANDCPRLHSLVYDSCLFMRHSRQGIEQAPLQLYCSALLFAPADCEVRKQFASGMLFQAQVLSHATNNWGPLLQTLDTHSRWIRQICFSPDGKQVVSLSETLFGDLVMLWDATTGAALHTLKFDTPRLMCRINALTFSSDSRTVVASVGDRQAFSMTEDRHVWVHVWDTETGAALKTHNVNAKDTGEIVSSLNNKVIVAGLVGGILHLCYVSSSTASLDCNIVLEQPEIITMSSLWGQDAAAHYAEWIAVVPFQQTGTLQHSPDNTVKLSVGITGEVLCTFEGHTSHVNTIAFLREKKVMATGSHDKTVRLWDMETGDALQVLKGHSHPVNAAAFSPDGKILASASDDCTVQLWDWEEGVALQTLHHGSVVTAVSFSPNEKVMASGSYDGMVRLWEALPIVIESRTYPVNSAAISPDGTIVASSLDNGGIQVWDRKGVQPQKLLMDHTSKVSHMKFSPNSRILASISSGKGVRLWDVPTNTVLQRISEDGLYFDRIVFSPDSGTLALLGHGRFCFWDVVTGPLSRPRGQQPLIISCAISTAGKVMAMTDARHTWLWDRESEESVWTHPQHYIDAMAFSSDDKILAVACKLSVQTWDAATGKVLHTLNFRTDFIVGSNPQISFSKDCLYLQGIEYFRCDSAGILNATSPQPHVLHQEEDWIVQGGKKLLWIHPDYRSLLAYWGSLFVFAHVSGNLAFIELEPGRST